MDNKGETNLCYVLLFEKTPNPSSKMKISPFENENLLSIFCYLKDNKGYF